MQKSNFADRVREAVRNIPKGQTRTYSQIAHAAGSSRACRVVGTIMKNNYDPTIPCHRVVRSDGSVGAYNRGGPEEKKRLLIAESAWKSK